MRTFTIGLLLGTVGAASGVQSSGRASSPIPIRQVEAPSAISKQVVGNIRGLIQLPDGRLLVNDPNRRRLLVLDKNLTVASVSSDSSASGRTAYPRVGVGSLYYYLGDSSLLIDRDARALLVIGPDGSIGRVMAHVNATDITYVDLAPNGAPGTDPQGRLFYRTIQRTGKPPKERDTLNFPPRKRDTIPIVRADFEKRIIDTVATFEAPAIVEQLITTDGKGKVHARILVNPVRDAADDWAVLSGGSLAIIRGHDYHIDWVRPNGKRESSPKMPIDWRRLTDADKQAKIDSVKRLIDSLRAAGRPFRMGVRTAFGPDGQVTRVDTLVPGVEFAPLSEMADFVPPVRAGTSKADRDNNVWILPTTSLQAKGGLLYDVVNNRGELFERVQLPKGRDIVGFGPHRVLYLSSGDFKTGFTIERTTVIER
jgi:hypothetical protein